MRDNPDRPEDLGSGPQNSRYGTKGRVMDFIDSTLIRIADTSTRAGIFDDTALRHMASAAYDADALSLAGPYTPVFDTLTLGLSTAPVSVVEGFVRGPSGTPTSDLQIQACGLGPLLPTRVDALWYGSIVGRVTPVDSHIAAAKSTAAENDISVHVTFDAPGAGQPPTPTALPIVAAVLIRDANFSIAALLTESKTVREQLGEQGMTVPTGRSLPARNPFLVVWLLPSTVFDDPAWPGTGANSADLRASRRENASTWLGAEGITIAGVEVG